MRDVLCEQMRVLGEEHPDTLRTRSNLAVSLSRQGDHVEAEEMCHTALASRIRVLGVSHPDTLRTARNLEFIRTSMTARSEVRGKHKTPTALCPTSLAEAEARARVAEAELLAMEEDKSKDKSKGRSKSKSKR
jgi:hypothetical protein